MAKRKSKKTKNHAEDRIALAIDDLAEFEQFKEDVVKALREDIYNGLSAEEMYVKYQAQAAARGITIAMTERDSARALSAVKDILDRSQGKAVERKDVRHRMENAKEEDIDAILLSKLGEAAEEDESDTKH